MADNLRRKCLKCGSSPGVDPNIKLYRFPNPGLTNAQRCELWAKFCFPEGPWSSVDFQRKLYSEHRMLCNLHFQISSFTDYADKKLNRHAVPDAEQNQSTMDSIDYCSAQPGPSHHPTSPIPGPSRTLMDITNIQPFKLISGPEDLACKIPLDTSKDDVPMSQPGPSKVPIMSTLKQHEKSTAVNAMKCAKYLKKICQLKNTIKKMKSKNILNVLGESNAVQKLSAHLTPAFALILQGELKNTKRKYKGRRWTCEQKIIALRLYKRSPSCYRLLRRLWCLPAPSTLKNLLGKFQLNVGLNDKIFKSLKTHVESQEPSNNEYLLMFDEMAIKKHLWYNNKEDRVDGYQDHGEHGRTSQEATHALVFMVSGIRKRVKQPVAFYLSSAYVTADRLAILIKNVLHKCFEINLTIAATVCDMGGVNRRALNILGASTETPYFNFENNEVVTLFDTPHLLKCFRNMFLKYNLKCYTNITSNNCEGQGIAKWKHIEDFFEVDNNNGTFVFAPTLRKDHLNPNNKQKMRVNLAAQVLSHSVAAGMLARIAQGLLTTEATITADVIADMDKLFDCVNSDTPDLKKGKPYLTNFTNVSPHIKLFAKMKKFFETCEFIGCQSPPPSKQGWIWTLTGIEKLFNNLRNKHDIRALATRRLQQDPLENLFGTIRGNCGANYNPTTGQFVAGLKTAIMSNLAHLGSGNCAKDDCTTMTNYKTILSKSTATNICTESKTEDPIVSDMLSLIEDSEFEESVSDSDELQACAYVCGFLLKHRKSTCKNCDSIFKAKDTGEFVYTFVAFKEYNEIKKGLNYASQALIRCVESCATICNSFFLTSSHYLNLRQKTIIKLSEQVNFRFLMNCEEHYRMNIDFIINSVFYITVKRFCVLKNRQFSETHTNKALKRKLDILQHK